MKFLCVPCDTPMKLESVGPPDGGSLSVVFSCPACGYAMAMLTNPYETQLVQSLGVRIGPAEASAEADRVRAEGASASRAGASAKAGASEEKCPFPAMVAPPEGARESAGPAAGEPTAVRWTPAAEARLASIPAFVRPMARTGIERFAREHGVQEVDEKVLDAARDFFGM